MTLPTTRNNGIQCCSPQPRSFFIYALPMPKAAIDIKNAFISTLVVLVGVITNSKP